MQPITVCVHDAGFAVEEWVKFSHYPIRDEADYECSRADLLTPEQAKEISTKIGRPFPHEQVNGTLNDGRPWQIDTPMGE
jgi:hypothetical protein